MDKSVDPCVDFYTYSCGGWQKKNPIPADQSSWSVYGKLYDDNQQFLWGILDDLSKQTTGRTPTQQKIGDYFAACMDEAAVEKLGATPLKPQLDAIAAMKSKKDLAPLLAKQQLENRTEGLAVQLRLEPGFRELQRHHRLRRLGRARPSRSRLLPED